MVTTEFVNYEDRIHPCYVEGCETTVNLDKDQYCLKDLDGTGTMRFRHLWHGVPGITRAVGGGGGFNGYAPTLALARQRAEYYIHNNPYAAPEVKAGELAILEEVERLELEE